MAEGVEPTKVTTESSKKVLKTVAGRLSKLEAGEMPTIQRVAADGSTRVVDHTGEMLRPDAAAMDAVRAAAEQFSAEHRDHPVPPAAKQQPPSRPAAPASVSAESAESGQRPGLWARIMGWFKRS